MGNVNWNDRYVLGIVKIDQQHQHLFELVDKAFELFKPSREPRFEEALALMDELERYVMEHFAAEEKGLRAIGYPNFEAHRAKHAAFTERVAQERKNIAATRKPSIALLGFLISWLQHHIDKDDREYAEYARSRCAEHSF